MALKPDYKRTKKNCSVRPATNVRPKKTPILNKSGQGPSIEAKEELRLLKTSIETISTGITIADTEGNILYTNPAEAEMHGYEVDELIGKNVIVFCPDGKKVMRKRDSGEIAGWKEWTREVTEIRKDGKVFPVQLKSIPVKDDRGIPYCIITIAEDITERKHAEDALRNAHNDLERKVRERTAELQKSNRMLENELIERQIVEKRLSLLGKFFENTSEAVIITDSQAHIIEVNDAFTRITGYKRDEVLGKKPTLLRSYRRPGRSHIGIWKSILQNGSWQGEVWDRRKDGEVYPVWLSISPVRNGNSAPSHYVAIAADISAIKKSEERLEHLAHHDVLTNLPNRSLFSDRLIQAVALAKRNQKIVAVMLLDLDRFKEVNDTFGHRLGDLLLIDVSRRLKNRLRDSDTISRLGGDEFAIILTDINDAEKAADVAQQMMNGLSEPFSIDGHEIYITTSIGITIYPSDTDDIDILLKNADTAMYHAKSKGKNNFQFFTPDMNRKVIEKLFIESKLRHALENDELELCFQPKVNARSGEVVGMEALLRWNNPELGEVPPSRFIPIAEDTGLIIQIGEWVIRNACREAVGWHQEGIPPLSISINLSARQFHKPGLVNMISGILDETGLNPARLELEITESVIMQDVDENIKTLSDLKALGLKLSVDDFGTGYSSLNYLKLFPIDVLKIDRSFVMDITGKPDHNSVVAAIIALAHSLNLKVIAEGVQTEEQLEFLKVHGCDEVQGYLFSKPVKSAKVAALFAGAAVI